MMQAGRGMLIFAEATRWLSIPWGLRGVKAGLKAAGFNGRFVYYRWHAHWQGWLVLPVIANTSMLDARAQRLAKFITKAYRRRPQRPIWLMGYSAGGYVACRALELLPKDVSVAGGCLLAAAISPKRDLNPAAARVSGTLAVTVGALDGIVGLGTLIFGTCDRKFTPSLGMLGYRGPACEKLRQIHWTPDRCTDGWFGEHFFACPRRLIAKDVSTALGFGKSFPQ